jgi:hypothetical protein
MHDHHVFIGDTFLNDRDLMRGRVREAVKLKTRPDISVITFELR